MTLIVTVPNLSGSPTLDAVTLDAGQAALTIGTQTHGTLAQVSGVAAGFDLFTPTSGATYYLVIRGQDAATGTPTNSFIDVVIVQSNGTVTPVTISSTTMLGTPGARTYSNNGGALKVALASGVTWYLDLAVLRFPA